MSDIAMTGESGEIIPFPSRPHFPEECEQSRDDGMREAYF